MVGKFTKLVLGMVMMVTVVSCEKRDESHKGTIEDQLIYSFRDADPELQQHVSKIVTKAKALKYQDALNKLALLAATNRLNKDQKHAINIMVKQLRYDMEEEIFSERDLQISEKDPRPLDE